MSWYAFFSHWNLSERIRSHCNKTDGAGYTSLSLCVYVCDFGDDRSSKALSWKSLRFSKFLSLLVFTYQKTIILPLYGVTEWLVLISSFDWQVHFSFFKLFFLQIITYIFKTWLIMKCVHQQMHNLKWNICDNIQKRFLDIYRLLEDVNTCRWFLVAE